MKIFGAMLILLAVAAPRQAESPDARYLDGLRERRLFELAVAFCQRRLERDELSDARRARLTVELIRSYAEHALHSPLTERADLFEKAHQAPAGFCAAHADSPRRPLVETQDALTWLAQGILARQKASIARSDPALLKDARRYLRVAIAGLEAVDTAAGRSARQPPARGGLADAEWSELRRQISFQLGRAFRNQAQCYPPASADCVNALTQALERLAPGAESRAADPLVWRSRLEQAICLRLLKRNSQAVAVLTALVADEPPPKVALHALAEKIRLLLAAGQFDAALDEIERGRSLGGVHSAELDFAHLEALLTAAAAATDRKQTDRAAALARRATAQVELIDREHGPYWMRRAEALLAAHISDTAAGNVAALRRAAESFFRGGQLDRAVATFDRAADEARENGDSQQQFDLSFTAASIERKRGHLQEATERYRRLAEAFKTHCKAPAAHLLAILGCAELARSASPDQRSQWLTRYEYLLRDHLDTWPRAQTADEARRWLGDLRKSRRDWSAAIAVYREISPGHRQYETAVRQAAACYAAWLAALEAQGKPRGQIADQACDFLTSAIVGSGGTWPEQLNALAQFCALQLAAIRLRHQNDQAVVAEKLLTVALDRAVEPTAAWRSQAGALLVRAAAQASNWQTAAAAVDELSPESPAALVDLIDALAAQSESAGGEEVKKIAALQLRVAALVEPRREELSLIQQRRLDTARARALAQSGRREQALALITDLAAAHPNLGEVQELRASLLEKTTDPAVLREALAAWNTIERKSPRASPRWFRARYAQAEAHYRLGDSEQALKLIKLTAVQHPELGGPKLKSRFQRLRQACEK